MWKTVLLLIFTLIVVPILAFLFDEPLSDFQKEVLQILLIIYLSTSFLSFLVSTLTNNFSQVDKLWSILPIVYGWIVTARADFEPRLVLMATLVSIWGLRLSFNFARRGGYSWKIWAGEEDYRWSLLRARPEFRKGLLWSLFNLFFISLYQMGLILLFTLPILKSIDGKPLTYLDWLIAVLFLAMVLLETIADQQQWDYHQEKNRRRLAGEAMGPVYGAGFVHKGLWSLVRHPNYAAEQAIWIIFYLFSIAATGIWINWSVAGCLLLLVLFKGSSDFSENISMGKYPGYAQYRERVGRFLPKRRFREKK